MGNSYSYVYINVFYEGGKFFILYQHVTKNKVSHRAHIAMGFIV